MWTALLKPTKGADTWLSYSEYKIVPTFVHSKVKNHLHSFTLKTHRDTNKLGFFQKKNCFLFQINTHQNLLPKTSCLFCLRVLADTITQSHAPDEAAKSRIPGVRTAAHNSRAVLPWECCYPKSRWKLHNAEVVSMCSLPLPPCSTTAELHVGFTRVKQELCSPSSALFSGSTPLSDMAAAVQYPPRKIPTRTIGTARIVTWCYKLLH